MTGQQTLPPGTVVTGPGVHELPAAEIPVPLGEGFHARIDVRDLGRVCGFSWRPLRGHNGKVYAVANGGDGAIYMHRLVAGTPAGMETDHINGDGLDNRRGNLRVATPSQNRANMGKPRRPDGSAHSSRFKGVSWDASRGRWQAKIEVKGRSRNLGRYVEEVDAARAYDAAAIAEWGPFAQLNFGEAA